MDRPSVEAIVRSAREGDPGGRDRLAALLLPTVIAWCGRMGGPCVDREEAAHDVLMTLLARLDRLHSPDRLQAFAFGITTRVLAAHRRRVWWRRWWPGVAPEPPDARGGPHADLETLERARRVQRVLDALTHPHREVLVLCEIEERTSAEVADLLGVPEGTVKSRLRLARARFREIASTEEPALVLEPCDE
jgi:RNA polymerase sigma factor (sigma-70 family)